MNDLDCQEFVEQVTSYLEGDESTAFVEHLALCDGCERYLEQMRQTAQALTDLPADALPGDARSALLNAYRRATSS